MKYQWDSSKSDETAERRGFAFEAVYDFEWTEAFVAEDTRKDYGEKRMIALGPIGDRLYCLVYTMRGITCRVISLRKASDQEVRRYEEA